MITLLVTVAGLVLMYVVCLRPMRSHATASCSDTPADERLAEMRRQVDALRKDAERNHSA